jgi:hypothetical protein
MPAQGRHLSMHARVVKTVRWKVRPAEPHPCRQLSEMPQKVPLVRAMKSKGRNLSAIHPGVIQHNAV